MSVLRDGIPHQQRTNRAPTCSDRCRSRNECIRRHNVHSHLCRRPNADSVSWSAAVRYNHRHNLSRNIAHLEPSSFSTASPDELARQAAWPHASSRFVVTLPSEWRSRIKTDPHPEPSDTLFRHGKREERDGTNRTLPASTFWSASREQQLSKSGRPALSLVRCVSGCCR